MTDPALPIAVPFIAGFEGFRSTPYKDTGGVWTLGIGFTVNADGTHVGPNTPPITREAAETRLSEMVARVLVLVRGMVHVPMTDNQAAALASFAYNLGTNALRTSTLLRLFEAGETAEAAKQFSAWVYDGGRVLSDLIARRKAEAALFLKPDGVAAPDATDALNDAELKRVGGVSV